MVYPRVGTFLGLAIEEERLRNPKKLRLSDLFSRPSTAPSYKQKHQHAFVANQETCVILPTP